MDKEQASKVLQEISHKNTRMVLYGARPVNIVEVNWSRIPEANLTKFTNGSKLTSDLDIADIRRLLCAAQARSPLPEGKCTGATAFSLWH